MLHAYFCSFEYVLYYFIDVYYFILINKIAMCYHKHVQTKRINLAMHYTPHVDLAFASLEHKS